MTTNKNYDNPDDYENDEVIITMECIGGGIFGGEMLVMRMCW